MKNCLIQARGNGGESTQKRVTRIVRQTNANGRKLDMRRSADKQARGGAIGQCGRQSKKTGGRRTKKESGHSSVRGAAEERFCEERMKEYRKWLAAENEALIPTNYSLR